MDALKLKNSGLYYVNVGGLVLQTVDGRNFFNGPETPYFDAEWDDINIAERYPTQTEFAEKMRNVALEYFWMIDKAKDIAINAHKEQKDKSGKDYYSEHIDAVANSVFRYEKNLVATVVAYLHDILEDTDVTEESLRESFPKDVADAVVVLTHKKNESYDDYIKRVKKNELARLVKIYDLANNMDLTRIDNPNEEDINRVLKYAKAYSYLMK